MSERKSVSLGERWRREATRGIDDRRLATALEVLPIIRQPMVRIRSGSIVAEMEGAMGSIHEVSIQVRTLSQKEWPTLVRVLRRSRSIVDALEQGRVTRSFDRLVARIVGEPLFPDSRRVTWGCSCDIPEKPCHHVLALHELFARRLDEKPWELLLLRGIDLHNLLNQVQKAPAEGEHAALAYGAKEEPVLYPDAEDGDLESAMTPAQLAWLFGIVPDRLRAAVTETVKQLSRTPPPPPPPGPVLSGRA